MSKAQNGCLSFCVGARESWDRLCLGLRFWDRKGQQACLVTSFQQRGVGGHDGAIPPRSPELPAGQRRQGRKLPLLQPTGIHTLAGEIRCHLDSVGLWLVLHCSHLPFSPPHKEKTTLGLFEDLHRGNKDTKEDLPVVAPRTVS